MFEPLSIAPRRCERERRTKAHHGRKLNGITIALISAKGGSRSERAQATAHAKTSCGEPTPSQRPRVRRPHGRQPPDMRQPLRVLILWVLSHADPPPMRQLLRVLILWVLSVHHHGNHGKSSLRRGTSSKSPRCVEARRSREEGETREEGERREGEGETTRPARAPPHCTERTKPHRCTTPPRNRATRSTAKAKHGATRNNNKDTCEQKDIKRRPQDSEEQRNHLAAWPRVKLSQIFLHAKSLEAKEDETWQGRREKTQRHGQAKGQARHHPNALSKRATGHPRVNSAQPGPTRQQGKTGCRGRINSTSDQ